MTRYTRDHEWIRVEGDLAYVGISEHAQHTLGDITFVELPRVGTTVKQGSALCVIESVKAASDVYAPAGGIVASVNGRLTDAPETVNRSAEGEGWICTLQEVVAADLDGLMDASAYGAYVKQHG